MVSSRKIWTIIIRINQWTELAYFGEIHPSIIKKLDLRVESVLGFEIFLDNIPESRKKIRETKKTIYCFRLSKSN